MVPVDPDELCEIVEGLRAKDLERLERCYAADVVSFDVEVWRLIADVPHPVHVHLVGFGRIGATADDLVLLAFPVAMLSNAFVTTVVRVRRR